MKALLLAALILGMGVIPAFAVTANDIYQKDHHTSTYGGTPVCGEQLCSYIFGNGGPHFSINPHLATPTNTTAYSMTIILPDNTFAPINVILSNSNYTALKSNIATMAVENIAPVNSQPTSNYCPLAKEILLGQDGYLGLIYNTTSGVDLTSLVYPSYCYAETGPSPYTPVPAPEFPSLSMLIMVLSVISVISITTLYKKTK